MSIGGYPISKINHRRSSLADYGYKIWCWQLQGSAYECPLEPLTQEFWRTQKGSRLAYGILLPTTDVAVCGDLLILATQPLKCAIHQNFGGLTVPQFCALYAVMLKLEFMQLQVLQSTHPDYRLDLFKDLEEAFIDLVLPRKDEDGKYFRDLRNLETSDIVQTDGQGLAFCPKCMNITHVIRDFVILEAYRINQNTIFAFGCCRHCQRMIAMSIKVPSGFR